MAQAKIKYFIYSAEQLQMMRSVESRLGKKFQVGQVIVNGVKKPFTELSLTDKSRYSDAKIVAQGDPDKMSYTLPGGR